MPITAAKAIKDLFIPIYITFVVCKFFFFSYQKEALKGDTGSFFVPSMGIFAIQFRNKFSIV